MDGYIFNDKVIAEIPKFFLLDASRGDVDYVLQRGVGIRVPFYQVNFFVRTPIKLPR